MYKSTSSIGCVGAESNALVDSNAGEPSRCTSGIKYFGTEDGTSVESSTGEPSKPPVVPLLSISWPPPPQNEIASYAYDN